MDPQVGWGGDVETRAGKASHGRGAAFEKKVDDQLGTKWKSRKYK